MKKLCFTLALLITACSYDEVRQGQDTLNAGNSSDFVWLQTNLFNVDCVSCHGSTARINLTSYAAITGNQTLVNRGDPAASLLLQVIESGRMPPRGSLSNNAANAVLRCWLTNGYGEADQNCTAEASASANANPQTASPTPDDHGGDRHDDNDDDDDDNGSVVTPPVEKLDYPTVAAQVLQPFCVSCHSAENPAAGIALDSYAAISSNRDLIDPQNSILVDVIVSGYMPMGDSLTAAQIKLVEQWVAEGAVE